MTWKRWLAVGLVAAGAAGGTAAAAIGAGGTSAAGAQTGKVGVAAAAVLGEDTAAVPSAKRLLPDVPELGYDAASARVPLVTDDGTSVVVALRRDARWGASDHVCVMSVEPSRGGAPGPGIAHGGCAPVDYFNENGVVSTSTNADGSMEVRGAVPDGVESVSIALEDGTTRTVAVQHNVFLVRSAQSAVRISFSHAGQEISYSL